MKKTKKQLKLGAHMSIAGGIYKAFGHGEKYGCDTIQVFVKSSNQWKAKPLSDDDLEQYHAEQARTGIDPVVAHDSYLINLGSPDDQLLLKSREAFLIEMQRCEALKIPFLVTHPGSHMKKGEEAGIEKVAESLRWLLERTDGMNVKITLETTAGQGTNLGYKFEHLAAMIEKADRPERFAVCFDTCHSFVAGYDFRTKAGFAKTWDEFDRIIGLDMLAALHLNDAKKPLGSRVDRHEHIGKGEIGEPAFKMIMKDKRFANIPKLLETPKGDDNIMDEINLGLLRSFVG